MSITWSTLEMVRTDLRKRWERGIFWDGAFPGCPVFPLHVPLRTPEISEWASRFGEVEVWVKQVQSEAESAQVDLEWKESNHRTLGRNRIPTHMMIRSLESLARLLSKEAELARFRQNLTDLLQAFPDLEGWARLSTRNMLLPSQEWQTCLHVLCWMQSNPNPQIYLREIPLPGMDTKFVEAHQGLLQAWLMELKIPCDSRQNTFAARCGFLEKPKLWRIRILDPKLRINGFSDLTLRSDELAKWNPDITKWIVIENDITALSFPEMERTAVLFGRGYGFESLDNIPWLHRAQIFYWGDIDTHGFAILSQFRTLFPQTKSLLMDRETLLEHRDQWAHEKSPATGTPEHLNAEESRLYAALRSGEFGNNVRLEQERISFAWVREQIQNLQKTT